MEYRPRASDELVAGYTAAAELAQHRAEQVTMRSEAEAQPWIRLAEYCRMMAKTRAVDDDQFQGQRKGMRHSKTLPMSQEQMAREERDNGLSLICPTENRGIPEWQWAAMELAMGYLSPMQRVCFEMHVAGRLPHTDIAEALSMDATDVKKLVRRAKRVFARDVRPRLEHIWDEQRGGDKVVPRRLIYVEG